MNAGGEKLISYGLCLLYVLLIRHVHVFGGLFSTSNFLLLSSPSFSQSFSPSLARLSSLMDGQIMYIQSSNAPDAVKRCDKSPGGGTERSGAKEWGDEEDTTSGEQRGKKKNRKHNAAKGARDKVKERERERDRATREKVRQREMAV